MFGLFRRTQPIVLDYWYVLIPDFETSTTKFYDAVGKELDQRKVPGLEVTRVLFPEGSVLSSRREYLQMRRERLLFEVCSASFGTAWFFSCRFSEFPLHFRLLHLLLILFVLISIWFVYQVAFGGYWGSAVFGASILGLVFLLKGVIPLGLYDLDHRLLRMPMIGPFYELYLRPNTYFREDSRIMYCDLVNQVVRGKVEEFAGRQEAKKVEFKRDEAVLAGRPGFFGQWLKRLWDGLRIK
jgi:hypothetical protein